MYILTLFKSLSPPPEDRMAVNEPSPPQFLMVFDESSPPRFPEMPSVGVKCKLSALGESSSMVKRQHGSEQWPSGALALHGMKQGLEDFTEVFRDAVKYRIVVRS